jgi:hypothetical protein
MPVPTYIFHHVGSPYALPGMARRPPTSEIEAPRGDKPLAWLAGEIKTPPLSTEAEFRKVDES